MHYPILDEYLIASSSLSHYLVFYTESAHSMDLANSLATHGHSVG